MGAAPTYLDKLLSPLPWLPWVAFVLLATVGTLWLLDRFVFTHWDIVPQLRANNVAVAIVVAVTVWALVSIFSRAAFGQTPRYDAQFRSAGVHYFGAVYDWRWFKAQGMAESGLRPHVCSSVGACGLMQIMPSTARELGVDPFRPREAIWAGVRYDRRLWGAWTAPRPSWDRLAFALMSYNAGLGNVLAFQRACAADCNRFAGVAPHAWIEPREYVLRISRWCTRFRGWGCTP